MLSGLSNYSTLVRRPVTSFGGLARGMETEENEFSDMQAMCGSGRGLLSSCGPLKKVSDSAAAGPLTAVEEDGAVSFYSLGEGGFYKNGALLPFVQFPTGPTAGVPASRKAEVEARCAELKLPVEIYVQDSYCRSRWTGDWRRAKLVRYGKYIVAVPQMLITDGVNTFFWKGHFFLMQQGTYYHDLLLYFPGLPQLAALFPEGEAITLRLNGSDFLTGETKFQTSLLLKLVPEGNTGSCSGTVLGEVLRPGMPDFTDVTCAYNRMFGVSKNRIYASKLGDMHHFNYYKLTPTDSWWADTESGEDFTAITSLSGRVVALKPTSTFEVYGVSAPFTVKDISRSFGCVDPLSIAEVAGVLILQTKEGLHAYGGSRFVSIQLPLGDLRADEHTVSCGAGSRYYIRLADRLYCYDYYRGCWYCVSGAAPGGLCACAGGVFMSREDGLWMLPEGNCTGVAQDGAQEAQPWFFETTAMNRDFTTGLLSSVELKLACEDASFAVYVSHDGGDYELVRQVSPQAGRRFVNVPVRPRMCSEFRIKVEGTGRATLCGLLLSQYKGGSSSLCRN